MFTPSNSLQTSQFASNPFQLTAIPLYDIDRSNGQFFPSIEGGGFYVEQMDFPCSITFVDQSSGFERTYPLSVGMTVCAPFKGITLNHPLLTRVLPTDTFTLKLAIFRGGEKDNNFAHPNLNMVPAFRTVVNTGTQQQIAIYVPQGARILEKFQTQLVVTTFANGLLQPTVKGFGCQGPISITRGNFTYPVPNPSTSVLTQRAGGVATSPVLDDGGLLLPSYCDEILVTINGTGLNQPSFVQANFA